MEIIISDTYDSLSTQAAADARELLKPINDPLLCTASGDTPAGLYKELVKMVNDNHVDTSTWNFVGLDEWVGMNGEDDGSCRYYLDQQLFKPLKVPANRISFFNGRSADLENECEKVESFIDRQNGIDLAILGLGMNGHAGMNEPGTSPKLASHVADIDPVTEQTGQKYFKEQKQLSKGITLGLATILKARHIFLLVSGTHKAQIVKRVLEEEISDQLPASVLRTHRHLKVYLDKDASALVNSIQ